MQVIDFGSSCFESERLFTYIQSRYYRSAEVIFGLPYGPPIDMWSFGCILAELLIGKPLFPGKHCTRRAMVRRSSRCGGRELLLHRWDAGNYCRHQIAVCRRQ